MKTEITEFLLGLREYLQEQQQNTKELIKKIDQAITAIESKEK